MILAYGNYRFALDEVAIAIQKTTVENDARQPLAIRETWTLNGMLMSRTGQPSELTQRIAALQSAFAVNGRDLVLYLADGVTPSAHALRSLATIGGVRVTQPPSFPDGSGAQYATFRTFTATLEADVPVVDAANKLISFSETLEFSGGGPVYGFLEPLADQPVKQMLKRNSAFAATQSGQAVGYLAYPQPPSPIWPESQLTLPDVRLTSPKRSGESFMEYGVSWSYRFMSATPLDGVPTAWR